MDADVAQLVEQRFRKAWVACSSQVIGLIPNPSFGRSFELGQVFPISVLTDIGGAGSNVSPWPRQDESIRRLLSSLSDTPVLTADECESYWNWTG